MTSYNRRTVQKSCGIPSRYINNQFIECGLGPNIIILFTLKKSDLWVSNNALRDDPEVVAAGESGLASSLQNDLRLALPVNIRSPEVNSMSHRS